MIATPKRHILARNRVFWHILRQNRSRGLGCSEFIHDLVVVELFDAEYYPDIEMCVKVTENVTLQKLGFLFTFLSNYAISELFSINGDAPLRTPLNRHRRRIKVA